MTSTITAKKIRKGSKSIVVVEIDGEVIGQAGGKRAERAQAVLVSRFRSTDSLGIYGVRGDLAAAQTEAHRLMTQTSMRHRSVTLEVVPFDLVVAVPVEEA